MLGLGPIAPLSGNLAAARGRHIKKNYERYRALNDEYNFQIPNFVSFAKSNSKPNALIGNDGRIKSEILGENNIKDVHLYIGRIEKSGLGRPYTKLFIQESIGFMIQNTIKGEKIRFYLGNFVGENLNDSDDGRYFTIQEQKKFLLDIFRSADKSRLNDFEIIDLSKENKELDRLLKGELKDNVFMAADIPLLGLKQKISSLSVFNILYHLYLNDQEFAMLLESPKPSNENAHKLYSLCEISIRLADLLNGRSFQGGSKLQAKYDAIISFLINPKVPSIAYKCSDNDTKNVFRAGKSELLDVFRETCSAKLGKTEFSRLYFDTDECERFYELKENRDNGVKTLKQKIRNTVFGIMMCTLSAGAPLAYMSFKEKKDTENKVSAEIAAAMKGKSMSISLDGGGMGVIVKNEEKINDIKIMANHMIDDIIARYGVTDKAQLDLIYKLLLSEIPKDRISEFYVLSGNESNVQRMDFVDRFFQDNSTFLTANGINTKVYDHFAELEEEMLYTLNYDGGGSDQVLGRLFKNEIITPKKTSYFYEDLGIYIKSDGRSSRLLKLRSDARTMQGIDTWATHFTKDKSTFTKNLIEVTQDYSDQKVLQGKELAYDYYWQTREEIRSIYEQAEVIFLAGSDVRYAQGKILKKLIISEYANNEKEISKKIGAKGLIAYITKDFYHKHKKELDEISSGMKPYALLRSITGEVNATRGFRGGSEYLNIGKVQNICEFISQDSKRYSIGVAEIEGRKYMVAEPFGNPDMYYSLNYRSIILAEEIGKILEKL